MDILVHASPEREWYVERYLLPKIGNAKVFYDMEHQGNIKAYLKSFEDLPICGNTWHMEDDVIPDRSFLQWAGVLEDFEGIVCGFGATTKPEVYSFPCIRIPNRYIKDFLEWVKQTDDQCVKARMELGKGIDFIFHKYWVMHKIPTYVFNPCMVEHIDDLIGGSLINEREKPIKAYKFVDDKAIEDLKEWLERRKNEGKITGGDDNT